VLFPSNETRATAKASTNLLPFSGVVALSLLALACTGESGVVPGATSDGGSAAGTTTGTGGATGTAAAGSTDGVVTGGVVTGGVVTGGVVTGGVVTGGVVTGGTSTTGGVSEVTCTPGVIDPGRSPLRRLNNQEYDNTVHELIGTEKVYSTQFPPSEQGSGFSNNADNLVVQGLLAENFQSAAEEMALQAVADLAAVAPGYACDRATAGDAACAGSFIETFGKRAFRRPLNQEEVTRYTALYSAEVAAGGTFEDGVSLTVEAFLQSPNFLYRVEQGTPTADPNISQLGPYELATRLAYFLWGSMPDATLFAAADANQLNTPEQLTAQATAMLSDERAHQMASRFHREWLQTINVIGATKSAESYPMWTPALATDVYTEAEMFIGDVFWNDGSLSSFLTAPYSYMNQAVASHYGLTGPTGADFVRVDLDPTRRAGILTLGAFLTGHANADQGSPIRRGKFVRESLLCDEVLPPPNDIVIVVPEVTPGTTTRERFEAHSSIPLCAGCHAAMDPIGHTFGNYDAIGRWQDTESGLAIDASGEIAVGANGDQNLTGPITGAVELAAKLANSTQVANCVATQWFRWGIGRSDDPAADACSVEAVKNQFAAASYDMRTLPVAIVTTDAFRYYRSGDAQ
jgi:hypothetical protein